MIGRHWCVNAVLVSPAMLLAALAGCVPAFSLGERDRDELLSKLSKVVLEPEATCDALRDGLGLGSLSIVATPADAGLNYEEVWLGDTPQTVSRAWFLPAWDDRGVVVLSMGSSGELPCYLFIAHLLVTNGWSVMMYEYEGFGQSGGAASVLSLIPNLERALDWTLARTGRDQATLMGISLGSVPTIAVAAGRPWDVNGVILDSPVALAHEIARLEPVLGESTLDVILRIGAPFVSEHVIDDLQCPSLFLMNEADIITPPDTVLALYALAPDPKRLVSFPGLPHVAAPYFATGAYRLAVDDFLQVLWPAPAAVSSSERYEFIPAATDANDDPPGPPAAVEGS